ncbi:hypothetical protein ANCDUO_07944 [Ancylostoma duodenale]|uniref:Uncharacterized protein n=1 Tax=Ancylostoma duodenale TaxID=51022 RepID=A0A0C2GXC1_9BILA|nr:hypothetical protein ANCDUO_07944 [Ancylostoma duodenale]
MCIVYIHVLLIDFTNIVILQVLPSLPAEHLRLQNKHRDALESNKAASLQEIVEQIEWRGIVYSQTPEKVAKLLGDPKEDLTLLSDRQLAVLLSAFGNACESVGSLRRAALMSQALQALHQRGVPLGIMARNAVLSARIDNGESLNVVEELKAWEADNMTPDEETFRHLSWIYAHSANTQGIVDIINHMKSNEMPISEAILESLIYSVAKGGHYAQAEAFVQKFVASANETLLRTAIARAAVARGEFSVAVNTIASIPIGAKLNQIANNKLLLEVLFDMLDAGEADAIEKLTSSNLKKEQRVGILADIATVLFSYDSERAVQDVMANYQVIYVLGGKDVDLAIPALEAIQHPHVRREYATALVQQLLRKGDPLAEEKLNKLLGSGAVQSLIISRIQKQISGLVLNRDKKEAEADRVQLSLAARLLALNFPAENSKAKTTVASKYLVSQLQSELLTVDRARRLMTYLEKEVMILNANPMNYRQVERHLRLIKDSTSPPTSRISDLARQLFSTALTTALTERKLDIVKDLWEIRICSPSVENALTYISFLFLNGRREEADAVCEDLRSTAQTITATSLQTVGDRLGDSWDIDEMRQLSQYLQGKFNLDTQQLLRIIACVRLRQLERLIEAGRLEEALQLVVEQTVESNSAFGQYQLAAAAVRAGNMGILKSVFDVVKRTHGKEVAFLDLAMVLLEEGRTERALKLLDTPQLKISQGKLDYFVRRAVDNNRPDVLRGLFIGLCQHDRASTVGLNKLLVQLCRMYYKANDITALESLEEEIERVSFPLEQQLRTVFDNLRRRVS